MKRLLISATVVVILAIGGWVAYSVAPRNSTSSNASEATGQNASEARTSSGHILDLNGQGLLEVGPAIYGKTDTTELILSNNSLKSLKSEMGRMTNLEVLKVDHNRLEGSLIAEIRKMPLRTLDASHNNMTGIPAEIGQLATLETLDYSYNKINTYPNELAKLTQLKTLDLTGNPFTAAQIAEIKAKLPHTNVIF